MGQARAVVSCGAKLGADEACGSATQRVGNDAWCRKSPRPFGSSLQRDAGVVANARDTFRYRCALRLTCAPLQARRGPDPKPDSLLVLSFVFVGIYWNAHHHLLQATRSIDGRVLWANLHLLFWLSLIPFVSGWIGENHFETLPVALYGAVLFMCGSAFYLLTRTLVAHHGPASPLASAVGTDRKGLASLLFYAAAMPLAFVSAPAALGLYVLVAALWFIPDRRIERVLGPGGDAP